MAVTHIYHSGAELGNPAMELSTVSGANFVASTTEKKTGDYSFRTHDYDYGVIDLSVQYNTQLTSVPSSYTQLRVGLWIKHAGVTAGTSPRILSLHDSNNTQEMIVRWDVDNTELEVYDGQGGTLLGAAVSSTFNAGGWLHLGMDVKIANDGWAYLYVNGSEIIGFDGDTNSLISNIDQVWIGGVQTGSNDWNQHLYIDDIYIDGAEGETVPSLIPRYQFLWANPDNDGAQEDWDGSDGNSVDNYLLIDDIPSDGGTTYISTDTSGLVNSVTLENESISGFDVENVYPTAIVKRDSGSSEQLQLYTRDTSTTNFGYGTAVSIGTDYHPLFHPRSVSINSSAWDQTEIDNLEVGIGVA